MDSAGDQLTLTDKHLMPFFDSPLDVKSEEKIEEVFHPKKF